MSAALAPPPEPAAYPGQTLAALIGACAGLAPDAAIGLYRGWLGLHPAAPERFAALFNLGVALTAAGDHAAAIAAYREAIALRPDQHAAAFNLGVLLEATGDADAALATWAAALQPDAARVALLNQRGRLLDDRRRFAEAEAALRASLLLDPDQPDVVQHWGHLRQKGCIWPVHADPIPGLDPATFALRIGPLGILALTDDIDTQRRCTAAWIARKVPAVPIRLSPADGYRHDRIRVGYLSSDFCRHAMGFLIAELLERHDRSTFEVFGYCSSPEDGSDIRARLLAAFDHHVPIGAMDDLAAARRIRADEIDILIDLNGLTRGARLQTLRWKPAPVQATYLGYIGPVPIPELDYLLCDDHVVPPALAAHYAPTPLPIGPLYQANDGRARALPAVTREAVGLPAAAFVFCCFSHHYKITPALFLAWCGILARCPGAVLWLAEDTANSCDALVARAAGAGIDPARLIFAPRVDPALYLARLGLADLFLDTFPYNAGTVASDALRMGLPIVTLSGRAFASRMAGSLLRAVGLPEGITHTLSDYSDRAVAFARDPGLRARARGVLADGAWGRAIGDCGAFTARLEATLRRIRLSPDTQPS